jgi:hypothetical protein
MKSRTDLINAVLYRVNATPRGSIPSAEDSSAVEAYLDPMAADLHRRNVILELPTDGIPDEMFPHMVAILASHVKDDFGLDGGDYDRIKLSALEAEKMLFTIARTVQRKPSSLTFEVSIGPNARRRVGGGSAVI